ncbi:Predicted arabinose efflux permease, MFS family [Actinacidiphila yanglinensis]|uniref:Predicted arabinose efflux permease, MFS family n=1 Tax=Actinacidiphila yanglinensis TaxID=310779 RepID=A0A1H5YQ45_9ACTN|nr:MFS transporter [Actinacidiphila yanglinensis]SEG26134.1 Predicted arabinose efflux permease, MFS family [Actinacidiphila yanglinensis]
MDTAHLDSGHGDGEAADGRALNGVAGETLAGPALAAGADPGIGAGTAPVLGETAAPGEPAVRPKAPGRGIGDRLRRAAVDTRPLAVPAFRRVLVGQGASLVGTMVTEVAIPVQVYALSHSSLYVGLAGLTGFVPIVVFGLYGGAVADAVDRRLLSLWSSLVTWAVTLALLVQTLLGLGSVALILVLVAVQGAGSAISSSTRGAIVPRIVPPDLVPAANTLNFTVGNVAQVLGPLAAGVLVALPHGFDYAYGLDAVLFSMSLYATVRLPSIKPAGALARSGVLAVIDGLRFISGNPVLLMSFGADIAAMVFAMPSALFPQAASARFHGGIGLLYASVAIGSVLAGLCSGWIGRVRRQGVALTLAVVGWATAIALAGFARTLWLAVLLLVLAGAADLVSAVYRQTILQTYAPDEMRGRMQGVFTVVVSGGPRLGDLRAGAMAATTTLTFAWSGSAFLCIVLVVVAALAVRPFWQYDAHQAEPAE